MWLDVDEFVVLDVTLALVVVVVVVERTTTEQRIAIQGAISSLDSMIDAISIR